MEVWDFGVKSDSLFVKYIHTLPKDKKEAMSYLAEAVDQQSKEKYIRDYEKH